MDLILEDSTPFIDTLEQNTTAAQAAHSAADLKLHQEFIYISKEEYNEMYFFYFFLIDSLCL